MTNESAMSTARLMVKWLRIQSLVALGLAAVLLLVDPVAAYSALFGGLAVFLPTAVFTFLVGRRIGQSSAVFLGAAVIGEMTKLMLTAVICSAVFIWIRPLAAGWFFAGLLAVLIAGLLGLIFTNLHQAPQGE